MPELSALNKAGRILEIINFDKTAISRILETVSAYFANSEEMQDEVSQPEFEKTKEVLIEACNDTMPTLMKKIQVHYANLYSEEELDALYEWYSSPLGQKVLSKTTDLTVEISKDMLEWSKIVTNIVHLRMGWTDSEEE